MNHDGHGVRIGIVVARFNEAITSNLLKGAKDALAENGVSSRNITIAKVPGSFEIPIVAKAMA
ncbi:MAG: 6,7-dimethyl-8-ribityllumazine synthase, partial [SAR202 cluster bacterium]|nr:6,7-dimethyl-8-ribityllumazine synthase [SAR202 cluster bacterium]